MSVTPAPFPVTRDQVLAFRLARHNLARRLPPGSLLEAAACGIQDSPPGSAALALNARILELAPEPLRQSLETDKTLLLVRGPRAAPYLIPTRDLPVFTAGLLPEDEESLRFFILGAGPALDKVGLTATEVVEWTAEALVTALDGRVLTFRQLSTELTGMLSRRLSPARLAAWQSPSWYGPNSCLGEAIVHFALYAVSLEGLFCFAPRQGNEACFVRTDQWLGEPPPRLDPHAAHAELLRRYLRCYGPSTAARFGEWAGISPTAASRAWQSIESELVKVEYDGAGAWLLERDLPELGSPAEAEETRLLPPHDPYLAQRDRETLLPDPGLRRQIWKTSGNPGVVLAKGQIVALWRPQKKGNRLIVTVDPIAPLAEDARDGIAREAVLIAPFRGCTTAEVVFSGNSK